MRRALLVASPPFSVSGATFGEPKSAGVNIEGLHRASPALRDLGMTCRRELVEPVCAMDNPGAIGSKQHQTNGQSVP